MLPPALLEIESASVLRGGRRALDGVSLRIEEGQHTAILGPNGSGKSTLMALITRDLYPLHGGRVSVRGEDRGHIRDLRSLIGVVSPALHSDLTGESGGRLHVLSAVAASFFGARGLSRAHALDRDMHRRTEEALEQVGATHLLARELATLSSGEARRVLIARALVHRPKALVLDEPCQGLDPGSRRRFLEDLRALARAGTTLIIVTHHVEEVLPEIAQVVLLKDGRILSTGSAQEMIDSNRLSELFDAPALVERRGEWYSASFR